MIPFLKKILGNDCEASHGEDIKHTEKAAVNDWNSFDNWFCNSIHNAPVSPKRPLASSWDWNSKYGLPIKNIMDEVEAVYAEDLLLDLKQKNIEGDIVEFGVFEGGWIERLWQSCNRIGLNKKIIGFDSVEGLPEPSENDYPGWERGQFSTTYEKVCNLLKTHERPNISLIKGWFPSHSRGRKFKASIKFVMQESTPTFISRLSSALIFFGTGWLMVQSLSLTIGHGGWKRANQRPFPSGSPHQGLNWNFWRITALSTFILESTKNNPFMQRCRIPWFI